MEDYKICFLCDSPADIEERKGDGGNRLIVSCSKSCPIYEITKWSIKRLAEKPHRKAAILRMVKTLLTENLNDLPVIRMDNASFEMVVTTRSHESKKK